MAVQRHEGGLTVATVIFCRKCGSYKVDVKGWLSKDVAVIRCALCDNEAYLTGFTLGRTKIPLPEIREAARDIAWPRVGFAGGEEDGAVSGL